MTTQPSLRPGPQGQAIIERDDKLMSGSSVPRYPFVIERGLGAQVWDVDGNQYIDFAAGIATNSTGHCHPEVVRAITEQAQKFIHIAGTDYYYEVQIKLAERLASLAPWEGESRVFLANSGAETIEAALKMARWYTKRQNVIAFFGAFHGRTMGALSLTASKVVQRDGFFPLVPGVYHAPYDNPYRQYWTYDGGANSEYETCANYIETMLFKRLVPAESVAAIVLEPIQGEGGYIVPRAQFVQEIRAICDKYGILLIADEIQTGVGRTGKWWGIQHHDVAPDIMCVAKGIASGMPLGAIIAKKPIMEWSPGAHGSTFGGNPISCAAALVTLDLIEQGMMANAAAQGEYIMDALEEMRPHHPSMKYGRIDGRGLMIGLELVLDEALTPARELRNRVEDFAIDNGLLILGAGENTLRFIPPLMIERDLVDEGLRRFDKSLTDAEREAGLL